jgi:hypothetical protein
MPLHYLSFRTFVQATEVEERVVEAMRLVTGVDEFERTETEGYHGNPIIILETTLKRKRDIRNVFSRLDTEDVQLLIDTLDERVDEDSHLYMRLDKQEAFLGGMRLADGGDVIRVRGALISHPKNREVAIASLKVFLESCLSQATD